MPETFDPYHKWLGIGPEEQPANHYRLLGIRLFEADRDVIDNAVYRQIAHIRTFQLGQHTDLSQRILNELAAAKARLLDPAKKAEYDAWLRAQLGSVESRPADGGERDAWTPFPSQIPPNVPLRVSPSPPASYRPSRQRFSRGWPILAVVGTAVILAAVIGWLLLRGENRANIVARQPENKAVIPADAERLPRPSEKTKTESKEGDPGLPPSQTPRASTPEPSETNAALVASPAGKPVKTPATIPLQTQSLNDAAENSTPSKANASTKRTAAGTRPPQQSQTRASGKNQIPGDTAQEQATKLIREVYSDDYAAAKTPAQKADLARRMIDKANETKDDPASHFVLLRVARDLAAQAGEADVAFQAVDALALGYEIDAHSMKVDVLPKAAASASKLEQYEVVVQLAARIMEEAVANDTFEEATQLGAIAASAARDSKNRELLTQISDRNRDVAELAEVYKQVKPAFEKLKQNHADPEANQAAGKYLCLVKGDWDKGIPLLASGNDEALKALAKREIDETGDARAQAALGDSWWELAAGQEGVTAKHLRKRAVHWYKKAAPQLTGLLKEKVDKRLNSAGPQDDSSLASGQRVVNLLSLLPANRKRRGGLLLGPALLDKTGSFYFPYDPPEEYDFEFSYTRGDERGKGGDTFVDFNVFLPRDGRQYCLVMRREQAGDLRVGFYYSDRARRLTNLPSEMARLHKFTVLLQVRTVDVKYFVNGELQMTAKCVDLVLSEKGGQLGFQLSGGSTAVIHTAQVREVTGRGRVKR
jgi:hypothetical protein